MYNGMILQAIASDAFVHSLTRIKAIYIENILDINVYLYLTVV